MAGGSALFGANTLFTSLQGYYAMAYLASEMLPLSSNPANATQIGYMAYAIWAVFDASAVKAWLGANSTAWAQVQLLAQNALNGTYTSGQFAGWGDSDPQLLRRGKLQSRYAAGVLRICSGRRHDPDVSALGWVLLLRHHVPALSTPTSDF